MLFYVSFKFPELSHKMLQLSGAIHSKILYSKEIDSKIFIDLLPGT